MSQITALKSRRLSYHIGKTADLVHCLLSPVKEPLQDSRFLILPVISPILCPSGVVFLLVVFPSVFLVCYIFFVFLLLFVISFSVIQ